MKRTLTVCAMASALVSLFFTLGTYGQQSTATPSAVAIAPAVPENLAPHPAPEQPLPFSHQLHVGMGLECQNCHANPNPGNQMTFPAASTCMTCHATISTDQPAIRKLTEYANARKPIPWVRVYQLPSGVTWNHRSHLKAGLQCQSCHGPVGQLPAMREMTAVTSMASCISCHEAQHVSTQCAICHAWPGSQPANLRGP